MTLKGKCIAKICNITKKKCSKNVVNYMLKLNYMLVVYFLEIQNDLVKNWD